MRRSFLGFIALAATLACSGCGSMDYAVLPYQSFPVTVVAAPQPGQANSQQTTVITQIPQVVMGAWGTICSYAGPYSYPDSRCPLGYRGSYGGYGGYYGGYSPFGGWR